MTIYQLITDYLLNLSPVAHWDTIQKLLSDTAAKEPKHWALPKTICEAIGGIVDNAIDGISAIACTHTHIILVDDMLDQDPRGLFRTLGAGKTANMASALQALGLKAIETGEHDLETKSLITQNLNEMVLTTTHGQYLDGQNPQDEQGYWTTVATKSSPFFGSAFYIGALCGGASQKNAEKLKSLGELYGEMIQIHDDLSDAMETPANPDWILGKAPLPILFAQVVSHPEQHRFHQLRSNISDPKTLQEAQEILIRCGAVGYCIDQLIRRRIRGEKMIKDLLLAQPELLIGLLNSAVEPADHLLELIDPRLAAEFSLVDLWNLWC